MARPGRSGQTDDSIAAAEGFLLTADKIRNSVGAGNDIFTRATKASADLSLGFGSAQSGALQLGKALQDRTSRRLFSVRRITTAVAPALVAKPGVGPDTASTLLITAGDNPQRLTSERSFAALCGTNPIPARSGKTVRYRLNRGGDRQANSALWRIAIVRLATPGPSRDYLNKHIALGKTKPEAIRCLKRHLAREIYAALPNSPAA